VSPANGSTEIWLGSHRDTTFEDHRNCHDGPQEEFGIKDECLEERRAYAPPVQATVKKGSAVLRDLRLWHAGLPNPSADARIMLAFVHFPWVRHLSG
jgi:ectoine hydroxylase-related dioxygenase (phytanoyl-CoA dioxygenase family)